MEFSKRLSQDERIKDLIKLSEAAPEIAFAVEGIMPLGNGDEHRMLSGTYRQEVGHNLSDFAFRLRDGNANEITSERVRYMLILIKNTQEKIFSVLGRDENLKPQSIFKNAVSFLEEIVHQMEVK